MPDDLDARLVVLGPRHTLQQGDRQPRPRSRPRRSSSQRGNTPRLYQNTLVFLAADKTRLQDLDEAVRRYLAWESILDEQETLDLSPHQVKQAETQLKSADSVAVSRLPETYQWLLVPVQDSPTAAMRMAGLPAVRRGAAGVCGPARSCAATSC